MRHRLIPPSILLAALLPSCSDSSNSTGNPYVDPVALGQKIFRYDTFGDEQNWTGFLRLHEVIETLPPSTLLALGIKVDSASVPAGVLAGADLEDPATTVALLELNAVVGVIGEVDDGRLTSVGVSCAVCHSTVDDSVAPGIGRRLDGWANTDLDVGAILAASPSLQDPDIQAKLLSWGPGKYDARFNQDGLSDPTVIPPAYGLAHNHFASYTGDGDISYWNAYVAVTQMGGQGNFADARLGIHESSDPDLVTSKLAALAAYQHSLPVPNPPAGSFDLAAAARGQVIFEQQAQCAVCHNGPGLSNDAILPPRLVGTDPLHAQRSATGGYRVTPLRGLWQHPPYFHDGSAATLGHVVEHYDTFLELGLSPAEKTDLEEFLKSL